MKIPNLLFGLFFPTLLSTFLVACSNDGDDPNPIAQINPVNQGEIVINGTSYDVPRGYLIDLGLNTDSTTQFEVIFNSPGIFLNSSSGLFEGSGSSLLLGFRLSDTEFTDGTFDFNAFAPLLPNTITGLGVILNRNIPTNVLDVRLTGGFVSLDRTESNYNFTFNLTGQELSGDTVSVTGTYNGTMQSL